MYQKPALLTGAIFLYCFPVYQANAQLSLTGQLRTRTEFRNGAGTLKSLGNSAAFFTSQRTRLNFNYRRSRVIFQTSLQDVRVWGQDASTISNADGTRLSVHEAWAELVVANNKDSSFKKLSTVDYFGIKIGRQELLYDDSRLLGNLDWLQQGRRHDAVVLKLLKKGWQADLGAAFNQNTDAFNYNGTYYTPANIMPYVKDSKGNLAATPSGFIPLTNSSGVSVKTGNPAVSSAPGTNGLNQNYKALQFLNLAKKLGKTKISALLVADHFGKYSNDSARNISGNDTGYIYGKKFNQKGVRSRYTGGLLVNSQAGKALLLTAGIYYQGGKDRDGLSLSAYTSTASLTWIYKKLNFTLGWDYVSGNDAFSGSSVNHRFDPLYGTPHKFWGFMDYFYVGTGAPAGGLSDPYLKGKYLSKNQKLSISVDLHAFSLAKNQADLGGKPVKKFLGFETDLIMGYAADKVTSFELGVSYMAASRSMEYAKNMTPGSGRLKSSWVYLQVNIRPDFLSR